MVFICICGSARKRSVRSSKVAVQAEWLLASTYVMASEEQAVNQFRGTCASELLSADVAPLISICKRIGQDPLTFPILNTPDHKVLEVTAQRVRALEMVGDDWLGG